MRLQRGRGVLRRVAGPQLLDQPVGRDDLAGPQQEEGEDAALPGPAEIQGPPVQAYLERPEDPEIEPS